MRITKWRHLLAVSHHVLFQDCNTSTDHPVHPDNAAALDRGCLFGLSYSHLPTISDVTATRPIPEAYLDHTSRRSTDKTSINKLLYADDQIIIDKSENELKIPVCT